MGGLALGFTTPWLLLALLALPVLWLILRAIPPAPIRRRFPGVALLLGLTDDETVTDRTPWWLLLLRMLLAAAVIIGLAGPLLNPRDAAPGRGPLMLVLDGGWSSAPGHAAQLAAIDAHLAEAARDARPVALVRLTTPEAPVFQPADTWRARLPGLTPRPWLPDETAIAEWSDDLGDEDFDTIWMSGGVDYPGRENLALQFAERGNLRVIEPGAPVLTLDPARNEDGAVHLRLRRQSETVPQDVTILARGTDPAGNARVLETRTATLAAGETEADIVFDLPAELRARVTRFDIQGHASAAAVSLSGDALRQREVALIAGRDNREGLELLSPFHYLRQALIPTAAMLDGTISDVLPANPDVIVLADIATVTDEETADLVEWMEAGGLLLRFAGPRLAASEVSRTEEDPLMPVRLRAGGRTVGGAMSWGEPKTLAPFSETSPFYGLPVPEEVRVSAQIVAQPDPTLAERVIAQLSDGTPLVTRKRVGQGQVVLFHVTANAEWSGLPLSGLFVQMLERLSVVSGSELPSAEDLAGTIWQPVEVIDAYGELSAPQNLGGVPGEMLAEAAVGEDLLPGVYRSDDRVIARNVMTPEMELRPTTWPAGVEVEGLQMGGETDLSGYLLGAALVLLLADVIASLALSGRLGMARVAVLAIGLFAVQPVPATAQDADAVARAADVTLGYVLTGDRSQDTTSRDGLRGLGDTLFFRTSVEPAEPAPIDLERDELAVFPLIYWPITQDQPVPTDEAYARLNNYLRSGGLILFDTRDADVARYGASSPNGRKLRQLARPLDIPPLELIPGDHVLSRTFYLLKDFPGRHMNRDIWVEAAPADAEQAEGMPFRNLNDGVTPVVIGGNDWARAWAVDSQGNPRFPVGRGYAGERQRELAYRFGVNLVMHVLTGNYKSDQVHVPALLDRLGQ